MRSSIRSILDWSLLFLFGAIFIAVVYVCAFNIVLINRFILSLSSWILALFIGGSSILLFLSFFLLHRVDKGKISIENNIIPLEHSVSGEGVDIDNNSNSLFSKVNTSNLLISFSTALILLNCWVIYVFVYDFAASMPIWYWFVLIGALATTSTVGWLWIFLKAKRNQSDLEENSLGESIVGYFTVGTILITLLILYNFGVKLLEMIPTWFYFTFMGALIVIVFSFSFFSKSDSEQNEV